MARFATLLILFALVAPMAGQAADLGRGAPHAKRVLRHSHPAGYQFPLSRRARDVRLADSCWRDCQFHSGRAFQACLHGRSLTDCVHGNDAADRYCLRTCRISGGPWVDWAD